MLKTMYPAAPHETAFSLTVALANTTYDPDIRAVVTMAFRHATPLLHTAACRLQRFCEMSNYVYGGPHEVLMERTLYPLYLSCLSTSMGDKLKAQVCFSNENRLCCPALPLPMQGANRYGLECKECSRISLLGTGRRCSLTFHCIPLLTRCPIHGCTFTLADECSTHEISMRTSYSLSRCRNSHRLGEILFGFSQSTHSQFATDQAKILLRQRGYIQEHGRQRVTEFSKDFLSALSGGFEDERLNEWINSAGMLPQALRSLRLSGRPAHPVAIALVQLALESVEYSPPLTAHKQDRPPSGKACAARPGKARLEEKKRLWLAHLSNHKDCTRNQARLLAAALWSWLYAHDPEWLEQHQRAPLPRTDRRPGIQATENIRARITASLRSSGDTKLLTRPRWRYRARINCGLPERAFDRLVTQRP